MSKRLERFKEAGLLGCLNGVQSNNMQWISIKDRLPTIGFWILTGSKNIGAVDWGCLLENDIFYMCGEYDKPMNWVTHWMPLPNPPKEE